MQPTDHSPKKSILIVAAEDSSCLYAERLLEHWQQQGLSLSCFGVGSEKMESLGFDCIGHSEELAVMGLQEVMSHWSVIKAAFNGILDRCKKERPDVAILLDYPGFNLRMAKKLKALGIPVVYYISPQVWAWKKGRVKTIKNVVDKMIVLFPFEKDFYKKYDYEVEFLGHPLLDEISDKYSDPEYLKLSRQRYGVQPEEKLIAMMPGSRKAEIERHLTLQLQVAQRLHEKDQSLKFAIFIAPGMSKNFIQEQIPPLNFPIMIVKDKPLDMISLSDAVLAKSGTSTLLVGLLKKPMVIMYRMKPLTAFLAKLVVRSTKFFGIVNLILDKEVSIELFQEKANVDRLTQEMEKIIFDKNNIERQVTELASLRTKLGNSGVSKKVAQLIEGHYLK